MPRIPRLDRAAACVLVVDVQERLVPAMWSFSPVERQLRALALGARELGLPVLATEQYPRGLGPTLPSVRETLPEAPLTKMAFSCMADEGFAAALAATGRKQVVLGGIEAHVCVFQTARDLLERGYEPYVCADAVTSRSETNRAVALSQLRHMGVHVTSVETALFDLLQLSGTPEFKRVSALVK